LLRSIRAKLQQGHLYNTLSAAAPSSRSWMERKIHYNHCKKLGLSEKTLMAMKPSHTANQAKQFPKNPCKKPGGMNVQGKQNIDPLPNLSIATKEEELLTIWHG